MVFGSSEVQDPMLERIVKSTGMACASVEYRLAPENPYPAAWDDCESVAVWLVKNAKSEFGTEILTIGGESAGATLAVATLLRLRDCHGYNSFRATSLAYGNFDASMTPSQWLAPDKGVPVSLVGKISLLKFVEAFLPAGMNPRDPDVSPLYANLSHMPSAIFTIGTIDPLLDDSLFLYARWIAAGNEAELAIYPDAAGASGGCAHRRIPWTRNFLIGLRRTAEIEWERRLAAPIRIRANVHASSTRRSAMLMKGTVTRLFSCTETQLRPICGAISFPMPRNMGDVLHLIWWVWGSRESRRPKPTVSWTMHAILMHGSML
jgi:acetyl esterase/lipase